jgi:DNA recombination protein RmuC
MLIIYIALAIVILLLLLNLYLTNKAGQKPEDNTLPELKFAVKAIDENLTKLESNLKGEFATGRAETAQNSKDLRTETGLQLKTFSDQLTKLTDTNTQLLTSFKESLDAKFISFQNSLDTNNKDSRKELKENLEAFQTELNEALKTFSDNQRNNFSDLQKNQNTQNVANSEKMNDVKNTLEKSVKALQDSNEVKLEEMRKTVDEKLEKTLETRLTQSFNLVSERLESVHKGLGDMQQLATGVGDLKKVLSNVKTRGILGEIQLSNILEQILAPEQYEINVITKKGTANRVEFAIKIPQKDEDNKIILMPIDSKFPIESYYALLAAYDANDAAAADAAGKALESAIKKSAKDIRDKYISPPDTTDIGLLFLPVEGLYAEAVRRPALMEILQRDFQIIVTGPTTLSAILNTISFGYRTMALEQRSGEIKKTLSAVKTEFGKFGDVLKKAQEKINKASEDIDELVGTRTKKINAKLKSFEELPAAEVTALIDPTTEIELQEETETE